MALFDIIQSVICIAAVYLLLIGVIGAFGPKIRITKVKR